MDNLINACLLKIALITNSIEIHKKLIKKGSKLAIVQLASFYCNTFNYNESIRYYKKAINKGLYSCHEYIGDIYLNIFDKPLKALEHYHYLYKKGSDSVNFKLGNLYIKLKDNKKAFNHYFELYKKNIIDDDTLSALQYFFKNDREYTIIFVHRMKCKYIKQINVLYEIYKTFSNENDDPSIECSICLDTKCNVSLRKCGHYFHAGCISQWKHKTCPMCRCSSL